MPFQTTTILLGLSLLTLTPPIVAQLTAANLLLTNLSSHSPSNTTTPASAANTTQSHLTFALTDPDPATNTTTTCGALWYPNGSYPTSWTPCKDASFAWYLSSFTNISTFTLEAQHSFVDASLGSPPEDGATVFARGVFGAANVSCVAASGGGVGCGLAEGEDPALLGIYAVVA